MILIFTKSASDIWVWQARNRTIINKSIWWFFPDAFAIDCEAYVQALPRMAVVPPRVPTVIVFVAAGVYSQYVMV